jgi:hypothetical protein
MTLNSSLQVERFSAAYDIVSNVDVYTLDQDEAVMDSELFKILSKHFGRNFLGMVGGLHYKFKPERSIPAESLAVPERNHDEPETLLIKR